MKFNLVSKNNIGVVLILLLVIILSQNKTLNFLIDTYLGRICLIFLLLVVSYCNKILGIVFVFLIIISFNVNKSFFEGLTTEREMVINDVVLNAPKYNPNEVTNTELNNAALQQVVATSPTSSSSSSSGTSSSGTSSSGTSSSGTVYYGPNGGTATYVVSNGTSTIQLVEKGAGMGSTPTVFTQSSTNTNLYTTPSGPTTATLSNSSIIFAEPNGAVAATFTLTPPSSSSTEGFYQNNQTRTEGFDLIGTEHSLKKGKQSNSIHVNNFSRTSKNVLPVDSKSLFNNNYSNF